MRLSCDNSVSLVPGYLDGELSEEQAAPLRAHLFDCPKCREVAKRGKNLKRWFPVDADDGAVPPGFAARVARRAMAGDEGWPALSEHEASISGALPSDTAPKRLLPFLLTLSACAAALLFVCALLIQRQSLPQGQALDATSIPKWAQPEPQGSGPEQAGGPSDAESRAAGEDERLDEDSGQGPVLDD